MIIANGLAMLELPIHGENLMYPTLIWNEADAVLFDAGLPGQALAFQTAIEAAGVPLGRLGSIVLTHQDLDHIGSARTLRELSGGRIRTMAHVDEIPFIQFDQKPTKMTPEFLLTIAAEQGIDLSPELSARLKEDLAGVWPEVRHVFSQFATPIDSALADGDELPICGGIKVIHTPGHTPGHCCFYLKQYKTLVAGDAVNASEGRLIGPSSQHSADLGRAVASLAKLADYDIEKVICYHGGLVTGVNSKTSFSQFG